MVSVQEQMMRNNRALTWDNWDDIIKYIDMFVADPEKYADMRNNIAKKFHRYNDSNASERVYRGIQTLL